jgi:hypothetical protein
MSSNNDGGIPRRAMITELLKNLESPVMMISLIPKYLLEVKTLGFARQAFISRNRCSQSHTYMENNNCKRSLS